MGVADAVLGQQPLHDGFRVGLDGEDVHREGPREALRGEALEHPCGARGKGWGKRCRLLTLHQMTRTT